MFDEPRQQSANKVSFGELMRRASSAGEAGQQVIIFTSEDRDIFGTRFASAFGVSFAASFDQHREDITLRRLYAPDCNVNRKSGAERNRVNTRTPEFSGFFQVARG